MDNTILFESDLSFPVPCDLVDKHLNAPDVELRLILLLLRNANAAFLKEDLLRTLGVEEDRLKEAFQYWVKAGILFRAGGKYTLRRPQLNAADYGTYKPETIAQRLEGDTALQFLYKSAEESLKKPLSSADASVILSLVDWCGLPADVVALLFRYGTENGKSLRQIAQTGVKWSEEGIKTFEQAEELIQKEAQKKNTVNRIATRFGIFGTRAISEAEQKAFLKWKEELGFDLDMIGAAYEETVKNTGKYTYAYVDKILTNWHSAGFTTVDQALAAPKPATPAKKARRTPAPNNPRKTSSSEKETLDLGWEIIAGSEE